ncbi:hypothetical protein CDAR_410971 [Caerostris darwini]|uniref:Uncharacterized protein n=1 Tax=Caerostris darwini TaxID=1538125 RepID=A0AAV4SDB9_9ARAC|nr:hypothetical protein CDAR_410971 [Caerostris darwini]
MLPNDVLKKRNDRRREGKTKQTTLHPTELFIITPPSPEEEPRERVYCLTTFDLFTHYPSAIRRRKGVLCRRRREKKCLRTVENPKRFSSINLR